MALSSLKHSMKSKLVCLVRSVPVQDTPEERVRQHLLSHLIGPFGCPRSLIGVEVSLKALIACSAGPVPSRRLDIVCFSQRQGSCLPLLIIECKASRPLSAAVFQLNGYNFFIHAPVIALAWPGNILVSHQGKALFEGDMTLMPTYQRLQAVALSVV